MRELNVMEMEMVVGGQGSAPQLCTSVSNPATAMTTCVVGDKLVAVACTSTLIELGGSAGNKITGTIQGEAKYGSPNCTTTIVDLKTNSVTTKSNTPQRQMEAPKKGNEIQGDYQYYRDVSNYMNDYSM